MSKLKKCLYLINLLERKGALTLKEINDYYQYSSICENDEILPRTFLRYKDYIEETFPCYIEFNQRTGKYELRRHKALYGEDDSLYDYLLSAYHIEGMTELALKHRNKKPQQAWRMCRPFWRLSTRSEVSNATTIHLAGRLSKIRR